jgi:5-formyltetrahydrofolate cyclo-ligase
VTGGLADNMADNMAGGGDGRRGDGVADGVADALRDVADAKRELRAQILGARRRLPPDRLISAANALADVLMAAPEVRQADVVAAYVSAGTEPGTGPLLDRLLARAVRVLLPVLRVDADLEWAEYEGAASLRPGMRGVLEPAGARFAVDVVTAAGAVLVPGLAVGRTGVRLGRGGGSYDRVLSRLPPDRFTAVLLYDDEVLDTVPTAPHDQSVGAAATPSGLLRLPRPTV